MSEISEHIGLPVGVLRYDVFRDGVLIETVEEKNLIVDGAKGVLSALLGGAVSGKSITKIGFGTNGAPPAAGNTSLTGAYVKAVDSVSYPSTSSVRFNFSLGTSEANGTAIIEFGLITADNTLFSRRVRSSAINKASDISFTGTWTITF